MDNEKEIEKQRKLLEANQQMLANTVNELNMRGNVEDKVFEQIKDVSDVTVQAAIMNTGQSVPSVDALVEKKKMEGDITSNISLDKDEDKSVFDRIDDTKIDTGTEFHDNGSLNLWIENNEPEVSDSDKSMTITETEESAATAAFSNVMNDGSIRVPSDVIKLPSGGEVYKDKIKSVQVEYITAFDENMITSPNLYRDGLIIDFLLKSKVKTPGLNTENLVKGDVDAITLWLRGTSYGTDFPITVKDPKTGVQFDTTIDLTKLEYKKFELKGDDNGFFSFTCPASKDTIKFKYLTRKDEKKLEMVAKIDSNGSRAMTLKQEIAILTTMVQNDDVLSAQEKAANYDLITKLGDWAKKVENAGAKNNFNKFITNRMEMSIVSVNGNTNREFIHRYVNSMVAQDALAFRKYMLSNEPGIDWEITVERPENLGGGSFKTFLEWDDDVFLNIS